jgi:hypothetical protein
MEVPRMVGPHQHTGTARRHDPLVDEPAARPSATGHALRPVPVETMVEDRRSRLVPVNDDNIERFRGRWVALSPDGEVVADAAELDELLALVEHDGPRPDVLVQRVPEADAPMFVVLG